MASWKCADLTVLDILRRVRLRQSNPFENTLNKFFRYSLSGFCAIAASLACGQGWTAVNNTPNIGANNPLLMTDGTVIIQNAMTPDWYKLTPDRSGNYATGTWTKIASMPSNWGPLYFGSQVMPDGRVFAVGGEYNLGPAVWTNHAGIYDPVKDVWTAINVPASWTSMGDTATTMLPNGLVYIADPLSSQTAAFNPTTNQFIYPYGSNALQYNDEAGLTMLPNGNIFRADCWSQSSAEVFNTTTLQWQMLPPMPYNVLDVPDAEMGPAIVQYNGILMQFGGNGKNIQYDPAHNTWITTPSFPGSSSTQVDVADGGAVLLPNGNILVDAGVGYGASSAMFFIWNGSTLTQTTGSPDAASVPGFYGNFLLLPNGQVLYTDISSNVYVYTCGGSSNPAWAPTITSYPQEIHLGTNYTISGTQFNGLSQGSGFGDDQQSATNYPIIKITSTQTGHVYYAKEYNPSTMAICTGSQTVSTHFSVPSNLELGPATIQVVTNGIASTPVSVTVQPQLLPYAVSLFPNQGTSPRGNLTSISLIDNMLFSATSQTTLNEELCAIEADFNVGLGVTMVKPTAAGIAPVGVTEQIYIYNWRTKTFVFVAATPFKTVDTYVTGVPTGNGSDYVGPTGEVRVVVRGLRPTRLNPSNFSMGIDVITLAFG